VQEVTEDGKVAGNDGATYTVSYGEDGSIINTLDEGGSTEFTFTKIWVDGGNAPGLRPTETEYTNHVTVYRTTDDQTWEPYTDYDIAGQADGNETVYTISGLPLYGEGGAKYTYAVVEGAVP